jgi:phosphoglycolate phosphatase
MSILWQLDFAPHECIKVGDSGADVGSARAAGLPIAVVPDGYISVPAESLGADFVLKDLSSPPVEINKFRPVKKSA